MIQKKKVLLIVVFLLNAALFASPALAAGKRDYYEIKLYRINTNDQVKQVNQFLKDDYIPALHRAGIGKIGVFHPVGNDTAAEKKIYVFIPLRSLKDVDLVANITATDSKLKQTNAYLDIPFNASPYKRVETIVLKAFEGMPSFQAPALTGNKADRIYELRSYESATSRLYRQKVKMFNEGGEIALFKRLEFNAVFYAEVLAGSHMPNLMYMTSFNNWAERNEHWKKFSEDPEWLKLKVVPEYLNTVSKNEQEYLHPAEFSEL
jgi:hypothetical protein